MERRRLSRSPQLRNCRYRVGSRVYEARLADISWDGARIGDVSEVPAVGTRLFLLVGAGESEKTISGRVTNAGRISFGVKFDETRGGVMRKLREFLRKDAE